MNGDDQITVTVKEKKKDTSQGCFNEEGKGIDFLNRDPHNINGHLQVGWSDVIAEPEGIKTLPCIWWIDQLIFGFVK